MPLEQAYKLAKQNVELSEAEFKAARGKTANLQAVMAEKRAISESMSDAYILVACRGDLLAADFQSVRDKDIRALSEAMITTEEFYKVHEELVVKHEQFSLWRSILSFLRQHVRITIRMDEISDSEMTGEDSDGDGDSDTDALECEAEEESDIESDPVTHCCETAA